MADSNELHKAKTKLLKQIIDDSSSCIYVCDTETLKLLYVNRRTEQLTGKPISEAKGKTCYEYLKNRTSPCVPCFKESATADKYSVREYTSAETGRHYLLRGKLIDWEGQEALIEYLSDETERINAQRSLNDLVNGLPGGIGIFNVYTDGTLEQVYLNDGYHHLLEDTRSQRLRYVGFSATSAVHPDDVAPLQAELERVVADKGIASASFDLRLKTGYDVYKWVNVRANVASREEDRCVLYAFYSDINELKTSRLKLEASQRAMEIASKSGGITFWLYDLDTRQITQDFGVKSLLGYSEKINNVPNSICGTGDICAEDEADFKAMYESLHAGEERSECTVRVLNHNTHKYEWQHMVCTRLHDDEGTSRVFIGFSTNVDLQQQNKLQYEHELQLRRELIKSSVIYYQLNLTNHVVEEYCSMFPGTDDIIAPTPANEALRTKILKGVAPEDKGAVRTTIFSDALLKAYNSGKTTVSLIYRRMLPNVGLRWIKTTVNIMKRPVTGELIAFLYSHNIDAEKKDQLAIESIMGEEIETVAVLNAKSGTAHLVRVKKSNGLDAHQPFDFDARMTRMIQTEIISEDRAVCKSLFYTSDLIRALEAEPIVKLVYRIRGRDGHILRKKARAFYLDETHCDIVIIQRDITDLYEAEQRQKLVLQAAVDAANDANRAKSEFLSRMSHDMRTPLTAILALSGDEMTSVASATQKDDYLEKIHSSGDYLLGIINDVLDMAKIENNKMVLALEPYSIKDFHDTIKTVIGEQCRQKNIEFSFTTNVTAPWLMLDKTRFNQIFINLLSTPLNSRPGRRSSFRPRVYQSGATVTTRFIICDTGIGMSPEFLPHAFDSFSQESRRQTTEVNQGTGLGLSIVKQLVDLMGGSISVKSVMNKGTTFTIELPAETAEAPKALSEEHATLDSLENCTILLCEDNPLNTQIVTSLLEMKGCNVHCAENGMLGLATFEASEEGFFDLVLMDIRMPVLDGLSATKAIRALDRSDAKTVPIIALTADAFSEDAQIAQNAGMNGHLSKPIEPQLLYEAVAAHIEK